MKRIILWAHGADRPGIVAAVSRVLFERGFNLEDTSMTILENHFAMIVVASHPGAVALDGLRRALAKAPGAQGLQFHLQPFAAARAKKRRAPARALITVLGADQPGIVYRVTDFLASLRVNVTDVHSQVTGSKKAPLYVCALEIALPPGLKMTTLDRALEKLTPALQTDIHLTPIGAGIL